MPTELLVLVIVAATARACLLQGSDTGECLAPDVYSSDLSFCADAVQYQACMPKFNPLWDNHTIATKDAWAKSAFESVLEDRLGKEQSEELLNKGVDEYDVPGRVVEQRFTGNIDCQTAYKNFICWVNFPRCDNEGRSLEICQSVCTNFFRTCNYPQDLWRCGPTENFNGESPEVIDQFDETGNPISWRTLFPGQPFRANEFDDAGEPVPVCTPSIRGVAWRTAHPPSLLLIALLAVVAVLAG